VRAGAGSARDSLSVLDQLIAGAGAEGVTYAGAVSLLGYTDASLLDEVIDAFSARDGAAVFEAIDRVIESGHDPRRFTADLLERLRDLIVLAAVPEAGDKGLLDVPEDSLERMRAQASRLGAAELSRAADVVNSGLTEMRGATAPRLLLELICARVLLPGAASDASAALARLDRLERRLDIGGAPVTPAPVAPAPIADRPVVARPHSAPAPTPPPAAPAAAATPASALPPATPAPTDPAPTGGLDAAAVRRMWDQILEAVKPRKRTTYALLSQHAQVVEVRGNTLVLAFGTAPVARQFELGVNVDVLREALKEFLGVDWQVETTVAGAPPAPSPAVSAAPRAAQPTPPRTTPVEDANAHPDDETVDPGVSGIELLQRQLGATVLHELNSE
jgi:DNA polymerase-3 subunit gamma/tau